MMGISRLEVFALTEKFGDVADNCDVDVVIAATSLFLADIIATEDMPSDKKVKLVDDLAINIKKYMRRGSDA